MPSQSICIQMVSNEYLYNRGETDIEQTENFDFGTSLLSIYDILDEVLDYLPHNDLKTLSKLDSLWACRIEEYIKKRLCPNVFCFSQKAMDQQYGKYDFIRPSLSIVFFNDFRIKLQYFVCIHKGTIKCSVSRKSVIQFLEENILSEEACPVLALSCKQSYLCIPNGLYFNGIVLPSIPGVNVDVFHLSKDYKDTASTVINDKLGEDNIVSCLLTFCMPIKKDIVFRKLSTVVNVIEERQPLTKFSFGGALITGVKTFNVEEKVKPKTRKVDDLLCVLLSTPKNSNIQFDSYSFKLTETMRNKNETEQFLIDFKKHFKKRKHCVAMRFSCLSNDETLEDTLNLFTKHFPDIPLTGFSCSGEIGWDSFKKDCVEADDDCEPSAKKTHLDSEPLINYFTTVFVILAWGKEI